MQKDPYLMLGLEQGATKEEVEKAYHDLKKQYSALRFEEGEVGANASKMIGKIERAYEDCLMDIKDKENINTYGSSYGEIEALIKDKNYEDAQQLLDKCEVRDAEWHYLQAQIYYKRQWHSEAKVQLEIACDLDPSNQKYKDTLDRLNKVINRDFSGTEKMGSNSKYSENGAKRENSNNSRAGYSRPEEMGAETSAACCNACSNLICLDCLCECMGGDCIPCI